MKLHNKIIWITGASSGIGKSLAINLSKYNCKLILSARRTALLEVVKSQCQEPENVVVLPLDLEKITSMQAVTIRAIDAFGRVDMLINNGGISQRSAIIDTDISVDRKIIEIDYLGTIALTKALLPHFVTQNKGHFVVVSSLMGKFSSPLRSAYCGAKHALHGFFDALRLEHVNDHIKVTMVCPGFVNTNVARNALTGDGSKQGYQDSMTEKGLDVTVFTTRMIKAIKKEKFEVYIGQFETLGVYVKRMSLRLLHHLILRTKVR